MIIFFVGLVNESILLFYYDIGYFYWDFLYFDFVLFFIDEFFEEKCNVFIDVCGGVLVL